MLTSSTALFETRKQGVKTFLCFPSVFREDHPVAMGLLNQMVVTEPSIRKVLVLRADGSTAFRFPRVFNHALVEIRRHGVKKIPLLPFCDQERPSGCFIESNGVTNHM